MVGASRSADPFRPSAAAVAPGCPRGQPQVSHVDAEQVSSRLEVIIEGNAAGLAAHRNLRQKAGLRTAHTVAIMCRAAMQNAQPAMPQCLV